MNITELFIRRPVMTTLIMIGIVLFGAVALAERLVRNRFGRR